MFYQKKYSVLEDHLYSTMRSLDYFDDAEKESQMPNMLIEVNWDDVKEYFKKETHKLVQEKVQI